MKSLFISILIFLTSFVQAKTISLEDVAQQVKESNFTLLVDAQRVYQAKESIMFSKRNLLPRLNLWTIISSPFDWMSAVGLVGDIAPFLVPNNWFRVDQSKVLYLAKQEQYRALWANQVMTAKLLYVNTLRDIDFFNAVVEQQTLLKDLIGIVQTRQVFGDVPPQVIKFLKIRELQILEDLRTMENLIYEEKKALSYMMGIDQSELLELQSIELPIIKNLRPINYETFIFRTLSSSPELSQYKYILEGLKYIKKEVWFSFLGASSTSRGVNGGVFDHIPLQDGLGFGGSSSMRITKSESKIIELNARATKEVLKRNLYGLVQSYNSYIENVDNQNARYDLAINNYELIRTQLILGENLDPLEILESITNLLDVKLSLLNYKYDVVSTSEKLTRLILNGDYKKLESKLQEVLND